MGKDEITAVTMADFARHSLKGLKLSTYMYSVSSPLLQPILFVGQGNFLRDSHDMSLEFRPIPL